MNNGLITDWLKNLWSTAGMAPLPTLPVNFLQPKGSLTPLSTPPPPPPGANGAAQGGQGGSGGTGGGRGGGVSIQQPTPLNQVAQNSNATYRASETGRYANGATVYSASNPSPYATPLQGTAYQHSERSSVATWIDPVTGLTRYANEGKDTQGNIAQSYIAPNSPLPMLSDESGNVSAATPQEMKELGYVQTSNGGWNLSTASGSGSGGAVNNSINIQTGGGRYQHFQTQQAYQSWARRKARNEKKDKVNHSGATTAVSSILGTG